MIMLNLTRGKDLEGIYIRLPAPQEKIEESCKQKSIAEMKKVPQNLHS